MTHYVVSGKQIVAAVMIASCFVTTTAAAVVTVFNYRELPEVHVDLDNKCLRVVNFRNGDGFVCQDRDVTLRKYRVISPEVKHEVKT